MKIVARTETRAWRMLFLLAVCSSFSFSHAFSAYGASPRSTDSSAACEMVTLLPCSARSAHAQFAIADFDGDRRPDIATVELVRFSPLHSRYTVSFQLSGGKLETIGITGPAEGLLLLARDVNGDRALDLVLVTAWRHSLVAVFLNDGSGNFAAADPRKLLIDVISSRTHLVNPLIRINDRAVLALQYSLLGDFDGDLLARPNLEANLGSSPYLDFGSGSSQHSFLGRAPPARSLPA